MYGVKTQQGVYHTQAQEVAKAFKEFWSGIMKQPEKSVEQCREWMNRLPIPKTVRKTLPLLTE